MTDGPRATLLALFPIALLVYRLVCALLPHCSASAATSSRQKAGMSGTTRPQTESDVVEKGMEYVSEDVLGRHRNICVSWLVCSWVWREEAEVGQAPRCKVNHRYSSRWRTASSRRDAIAGSWE